MDLLDSIRKISANVELQRDLMRTEEATKQVSIRPFIEALGYDTSVLSEVTPEYIADARSSGGERVDYAIKQGGIPIILIESKSANTNFTENHWRQLHNYFNAEDVRFGILTNGLEYRFFTDLKKRNIMDKHPFMTIDMLNLDERTVSELEGFTKSGYDPERILSNAQKSAILQLLSRELSQPSEEFVKHFARQLHSGPLSYHQIQRYTHLVKQACRELLDERKSISSALGTDSQSENSSDEIALIRDRIQPFPSRQTNQTVGDIDSRPSEPKLLRDNAYPARRLYEWGTKAAKGFIKNRRGNLRIYDAAGEKHFWVEDEKILDGTCYPEMDIEISKSHRIENDNPPPESRLVNVIPTDQRFNFEYKHRGSGRYVVTKVL